MPKTSRTNQTITPSNHNNNRYTVIPEGLYIGVLTGLDWSTFPTNQEYSMEKFTPTLRLLNENGTQIDRQDLTIGAIDEDGDYTNKYFDSPTSSVIFGGFNLERARFGAQNFMFTLGMLNSEGEVVFNEEAIVDLVVRVRIKTRTYTWKGQVRHENVVTYWDVPTASDSDSILEADIDTSEWVVYNLCVKPASDEELAEYAPLVFANQQAFDIWWETMYTDTEEWEHPTGAIEDENQFFMSWDAWVYGEDSEDQETPDEETPEASDDAPVSEEEEDDDNLPM